MEKIEKVLKEVELTTRICDICDGDKPTKRKCHICSRDICEECTVHDTRDTGDYLRRYCRPCWVLGNEYLERILRIKHEFERIVEGIENEWHNEAMRALRALKRR